MPFLHALPVFFAILAFRGLRFQQNQSDFRLLMSNIQGICLYRSKWQKHLHSADDGWCRSDTLPRYFLPPAAGICCPKWMPTMPRCMTCSKDEAGLAARARFQPVSCMPEVNGFQLLAILEQRMLGVSGFLKITGWIFTGTGWRQQCRKPCYDWMPPTGFLLRVIRSLVHPMARQSYMIDNNNPTAHNW